MKLSIKVFLILFIAFGLISCNVNQSDSSISARKVSDLMNSSSNRQDAFSGLVVAQQTKEITKDETKKIKEILVSEGDSVTEETVLFTYDSDAMRLDVEKAQLEIERMNNSITSNYNQITTLANERDAAPASQQFSYTLEIQTLQAEISETEYNIRAKQAELDRLVTSVENSEVKAGISGIVQTINDGSNPNQFGEQSNAFITVLQTGNYRVKGQINELNISQLTVGSPVSVISRIDSTKVYPGIVEAVEMNNPSQSQNNMGGMPSDQMANSSNYPFYISLDQTEGLFLGQHVHVVVGQVETVPKEGAWIMSQYIVFTEEGQTKIWKADSNKATLVEIVLGDMDPNTGEMQVLEGLTVDDYIIEPNETLKEGSTVTLVEGH